MKLGLVVEKLKEEGFINLNIESNEFGLLKDTKIQVLTDDINVGDIVYFNKENISKVNNLNSEEKEIIKELSTLKKEYLKSYKEIVVSLEIQSSYKNFTYFDHPIKMLKNTIEKQKYLINACDEITNNKDNLEENKSINLG